MVRIISAQAIKSGNTARSLQYLAKPHCSQLDAVLAAVKAPGEASACVRRQRDGQPWRRLRPASSRRQVGTKKRP